MNKLAALVLKHKAAKYGIPADQGWITRQQAARQLGCPERNVQEMLRDAIAAKDIEIRKFMEWDAATMRPLQVTCYRITADTPAKPAKPTAPPATPADTDEVTAAILRAHHRHPHLPHHRLPAYLPPRIRTGVTVAQIAEILSQQ